MLIGWPGECTPRTPECPSLGVDLPKAISGGTVPKTILFRDSCFLLGWDLEESINQGKRRGHGGVQLMDY